MNETKHLRLHLVTPALPPMLDGIGDYTALLAAQLSTTADVRIYTDDRRAFQPVPNVPIVGAFDAAKPASIDRLLAAVAADPPDWLVIQYNPFGWGQRGLNLHLPRAMHRLRSMAPSVRLAVMFHETFVPLKNWKFAVMTTWQRWQFRQLVRASDVALFSIDPWAVQHRRAFRDKRIEHLPVGSNVPRVAIDKAEARRRLNIADDEVIVGVFGTGHVSRLFDRVRDAAVAVRSTGRPVRILYIGPDIAAVRSAMGDVSVIGDGSVSADEASRRLAAIDVFLATYSDGVSTRRGAMMAALEHGLPIVGTLGHHTDAELRTINGSAMLLANANDSPAFSAAVVSLVGDAPRRASLGRTAADLFARRYAWPVIADRLLAILNDRPAQRDV